MDASIDGLPEDKDIRASLEELLTQTVKSVQSANGTPDQAYSLCAMLLTGAATVIDCIQTGQ